MSVCLPACLYVHVCLHVRLSVPSALAALFTQLAGPHRRLPGSAGEEVRHHPAEGPGTQAVHTATGVTKVWHSPPKRTPFCFALPY